MLELPLGPLMVDVKGLDLDQYDIELLRSPAVGAIILFARNFDSRQQVAALIEEIKALRTPELLIAVDQEGGRVQRFRDEFFQLPPAQIYGHIFDGNADKGMDVSRSAGMLMAKELIDVGVDFSFAPVLDCTIAENVVIGDRGFHTTALVVCQLAGAFIDGMNTVGMAATGKHFPGHGGVTKDSHFLLPKDQRSFEELLECDLIPYQQLANKLTGIMTAHVLYPNIDESLPTFSAYWIKEVLRNQIGFNGVVFSDDLTMKGAHGEGSPLQRTCSALNAGCDMALICNDPEAANEVSHSLSSSTEFHSERLELMRRHNPSIQLELDTLKEKLHTYL